MGKFNTAGLLLVALLFIETAQFCLCGNSSFGCIEEERQALLKFKRSLRDPALRLSSWEGIDCCKWEGVSCSTSTGHVVKLDLRRRETVTDDLDLSDYSNVSDGLLMAREINSCLLELSYLNYLDFSGNDFEGTPIPKFLGLMGHLRYLNLSYANFSGMVPPQLGNLTNLRVLDLNNLSGAPTIQNLEWVSRLWSLQHLDMSGVHLGGARNVMQVLNMLPSLLVLRLAFCELNNTHLSQAYANSTFLSSVEYLDLEGNSFHGPFPHVIQNMSSLRALDLSSNSFNSSIPHWLSDFQSLVHLNLASNEFNGIEGGSSITHLSQASTNSTFLSSVEYLDLGGNSFHGPLPHVLQNMTSLRVLDLSNNQLNGTIPKALGELSSLRTLNLSNNQLNGVIPDSLGKLLNLQRLDISSNSLEGKLSGVQDLHVSTLDLSHNQISGRFPILPHVEDVFLSNNSISGPLPQNIGHMMRVLKILYLDQNLINGTIPSSLCKIETLLSLDLSNNSLSGSIPNCWRNLRTPYTSNSMFPGYSPTPNSFGRYSPIMPSYLYDIDLSSNRLIGPIPSSFGNLSDLAWLHLNNNSLNGELPSTLRDCKELIVLDLGENKLSGNIPKWIGEKLGSLHILRLRNNAYKGSIPPQICNLLHLKILDLAYNNLTGTIPRCFGKFVGMAHEEDFPSVYTRSYLPTIGNWDKQKVMEVIKGRELKYEKITRLVVNMDLSSNNLVGMIPEELTTLSILIGLNLSHNHLTGTIPKNVGNLRSLESLDFSSNHLSGLIPQSMSALTLLSHLNLSYNNLFGQIPTGNQLQTLDDPSIYAGNLELCGAPLPNKCPGDEPHEAPTPIGHEENDKEGVSEKVWFYIVVMLGFMTGLWGTLGVLIFKKSWRYAYFRLVDETKDRIIVAIAVKVARLKKKMRRNHPVN